jgi:hypothetical protein
MAIPCIIVQTRSSGSGDKIYHSPFTSFKGGLKTRSKRVMLDFDPAELYEVVTKVLNQAVN